MQSVSNLWVDSRRQAEHAVFFVHGFDIGVDFEGTRIPLQSWEGATGDITGKRLGAPVDGRAFREGAARYGAQCAERDVVLGMRAQTGHEPVAKHIGAGADLGDA